MSRVLAAACLSLIASLTARVEQSGEQSRALKEVAAARQSLADLRAATTKGDVAGASRAADEIESRLLEIERLIPQLGTATAQSTITPRGESNEIPSRTTTVIVEASVSLLGSETRDLWVAVVPEANPSSMFVQGNRITRKESSVVVNLGRPQSDDKGWYKVVLISVKKGAIKKEEEILMTRADELGVEEEAFLNLHRTK